MTRQLAYIGGYGRAARRDPKSAGGYGDAMTLGPITVDGFNLALNGPAIQLADILISPINLDAFSTPPVTVLPIAVGPGTGFNLPQIGLSGIQLGGFTTPGIAIPPINVAQTILPSFTLIPAIPLLASGELGQHNGLPASIIATTTLQELQAAAGRGLTGGGTILPMSDVIRLARHANHYLAIFDQGTAVALYHTKRLASPGQRIVLYAKERGCSAPGCDVSEQQVVEAMARQPQGLRQGECHQAVESCIGIEDFALYRPAAQGFRRHPDRLVTGAREHLLGISPHCVKVYERKGRIVVGERFFVALQPARRVQPDRPVTASASRSRSRSPRLGNASRAAG